MGYKFRLLLQLLALNLGCRLCLLQVLDFIVGCKPSSQSV
jgi:hypothetical protein